MTKQHQIHIVIRYESKQKFQEWANARGVSLSALMILATSEYVASHSICDGEEEFSKKYKKAIDALNQT